MDHHTRMSAQSSSTDLQMTAGVAEAYGKKSLDEMPSVPAGRAGRPEEIADVIVFLSSENASYVNGVTWQVAGGMGA